MNRTLQLHPSSRCAAVRELAVDVARPSAGALALRYVVTGDIAALCLPEGEPTRTDALWRTTCFEAFARARADPSYFEFNVAPSGAWAAYRFDAPRAGMRAAEGARAPEVATAVDGDTLTVDIALDFAGAPELSTSSTWRLAVSAVIEETNGAISYWALRHPPGPADFHHPDGFVIELALTERP